WHPTSDGLTEFSALKAATAPEHRYSLRDFHAPAPVQIPLAVCSRVGGIHSPRKKSCGRQRHAGFRVNLLSLQLRPGRFVRRTSKPATPPQPYLREPLRLGERTTCRETDSSTRKRTRTS